jgi:hypothetical protein
MSTTQEQHHHLQEPDTDTNLDQMPNQEIVKKINEMRK